MNAFSYAPDTASISWHETVAGSKTATSLSDFYTKVVQNDVDTVTMILKGLTSITNLAWLPTLNTLTITNNPLITSLDISGNPLLTRVNMPACTGITGITLNTALQTLIANPGGLVSLDVTNLTNPKVFTLNSNALTSVAGFSNKPTLQTVDLTGNGLLTSVNFANDTSLVSLILAGGSLLNVVVASNCALSSSQVNAILHVLALGAVNGGTCNLSGQTPAAPPTGQGIVDKATLLARTPPWTVTTD